MGRSIVLALMALLFFAVPAPVRADQTDKRLDALFVRLKAAKDAAEGRAITTTIWHIWYETKDEKARGLLSDGIDAMDRQDFDSAKIDFDRLVKDDPNFAEGWNRRATLRYLVDDLGGSVQDIEQTLKLEPRHFGALSGLGLIYLQLGDDKAALKAFKRALEINPYLTSVKANVEEIEKRLKGRAI